MTHPTRSDSFRVRTCRRGGSKLPLLSPKHTNARGETLEQKTEAYIGEVWYTIARNQMTYYEHGKRIRSENLAGQVATTAWNQYVCNPVGELVSGAKLGGPGSVPAAGDTTTWLYGDGGWMIASSRLCGRHRKPNSFLALLHFAADGEGHDRKNRSGQPEIAQTGVQAGMSYCINPTVSISSVWYYIARRWTRR